MSKTSVVFFENAALCAPSRSSPLRPLARTNNAPFVRPPSLTPTNQSLFQSRVEKSTYRSTRLAASSGPGPSKEDSILKDIDTDKLIKDAQDKWEKVEDKTSLAVYVGGAILLLFVGGSVVSAFDRLPLFPKIFQLVGLIYTSWFVYRYLLFKSSRQELISDVEELKNKISGGK